MQNGSALFLGLVLSAALLPVAAASPPDYLPPWNPPLTGGKAFSAPEIDVVSDLYGEATDPQLTVFFAGNQYMVVPDLLQAFRLAHPEYTRIFVETLPPGVLIDQVAQGALIMGNLRLTLKPDIYTEGSKRLAELQVQRHWFAATEDYTRNHLAIMVYAGNPLHITGLADLGRPEVRVSMPNPAWEGVAKNIEALYRKAGGDALDRQIMDTKVKAGSTYLTTIHHRETPLRVMRRESDAGPVWYSEAYYQQAILNHPVAVVEIPAADNVDVAYAAGLMKDAPHPQAAAAFMQFLLTPAAQAVYRRYGFEPLEP